MRRNLLNSLILLILTSCAATGKVQMQYDQFSGTSKEILPLFRLGVNAAMSGELIKKQGNNNGFFLNINLFSCYSLKKNSEVIFMLDGQRYRMFANEDAARTEYDDPRVYYINGIPFTTYQHICRETISYGPFPHEILNNLKTTIDARFKIYAPSAEIEGALNPDHLKAISEFLN